MEKDNKMNEKELLEFRQREEENFLRYGSDYSEEELKNILYRLENAIDARAQVLPHPILPVGCGCDYFVIAEHNRHLDAGQLGQIRAVNILLREIEIEKSKHPTPSVTCAVLTKHEQIVRTGDIRHNKEWMEACGDPAENVCTRCKKDLCAWHTHIHYVIVPTDDGMGRSEPAPGCEDCKFYF